ncbi:MAG: Phage shock protein A [Candidatus Hydrogenedentes bacterium ADurb.Bin179]|nr:MAG: Phage shock protein A [Candidatus Hydrogenedentes bacterium ADurb.Bin179]
MSIFSRLGDIISSNINAMLDKAENPEKMVKLIIQEMEDTLIEIKANCAGAMATEKRIQREMAAAAAMGRGWNDKAMLAIDRDRPDLAREALFEKRRYIERAEALEREQEEAHEVVGQYQQDIQQLEEKLAAARERQRVLVQRHHHAQDKHRAQTDIRRYETSEAARRFNLFEQRIDRMEAEAELVNMARKPGLEESFAALEQDNEIEKELAALMAKKQGPSSATR